MQMSEDRRLEVLKMIKADVVNDLTESEGEPFTGRNVHVLFGKQAAAIQALANIVETLVLEEVKMNRLKEHAKVLDQMTEAIKKETENLGTLSVSQQFEYLYAMIHTLVEVVTVLADSVEYKKEVKNVNDS